MKRKISFFLLLVCMAVMVFHTPAQAAKLNKKKLTLTVGKTATLKLKKAKGKVKWSSANKKIAKVNKKGKVIAISSGSTTIKAKNQKKTYKCKVKVKKKFTTQTTTEKNTTNPNTEQKTTEKTTAKPTTEQPKVETPTSEFVAKAKVHYIDVGQGNAELIQVNDKNILIDTGKEVEYQNLAGYFHSLNIKKIDIMIISHYDEDHMGSAERIFDDFEVEQIYTSRFVKPKDTKAYRDYMAGLEKHNLSVNYVMAGDEIALGNDARIMILGPIEEADNDNDNSVVSKFIYGKTSYLNCGDIAASVENSILAKYDVSADVFLANHHGSAYSNAALFISKVNPMYSVFSVGADNEYGHPHDVVYRRIKSLTSVGVFRTDQDGTIIISTDGNQLQVVTKKTAIRDSTEQDLTTQSPTTEAPVVNNGSIIGNINSKVYHSPKCANLPAEHNRVYFISWQAAEAAGYHACGNCHGGKE